MRVLFLLACLVGIGAAASAGDAVPAGRYAVQPNADGFVRLDTLTGAVSHCGRRAGVWFCEPLAEDRSPLAARVDALVAKVDALAAKVDALAARTARAPPEESSFTERLVRRLFIMVKAIKTAQAG